MAASLINACTFNAYTGAFQVLSFANMWTRLKSMSVTLRVVPFVVVMALGVVVAFFGYKNFVTNLSNFLDVLLVIFIPWSAVNLTDYFLVRHGEYHVASFFMAQGRYGRFLWRGLLAYVIGLAGRSAVRLPAGLHRRHGQAPRRRRHLLAGRLDRVGSGLPAAGPLLRREPEFGVQPERHEHGQQLSPTAVT